MKRKVRDSCGKAPPGGDRRRKGAEEAPGPPAESECLEATFEFVYNLKVPFQDTELFFCKKTESQNQKNSAAERLIA
ncbi:hypothetical protein CW306_09425 [Bacillus sp. BA3]|nr:hypothetical protein CW306_09425 [Bacillus sp. BA3]